MSTAPYSPDTPALLPYTLGQVLTVVASGPSLAQPLTLEVGDGTNLVWDESTAPRCVLTVIARVPEDQATLDALDPRSGVTLSVTAGYARPDGVDAHLIAQLRLRQRTVSRPSNVLTLTASGEESDVLEAANPTATFTPDDSDVTRCVEGIVTDAMGYAPVYTSTIAPALAYTTPTDGTDVQHVVIGPDQGYYDALDDVLDRVGADAYDNGLGVWVLEPRPVVASTPSHHLAVGQHGTVLDASTGLTRAGWYNRVQLVYRWDQSVLATDSTGKVVLVTTPQMLVGAASVTSGAHSVANAGRVTYTETRDVRTSQPDANKAASAILARKISLGRTLTLSAIAAWWLRPGHTVTAALPTGATESHLVSRVAFDCTAGRMTLDTRRPDSDTTITQGA